VVRGISTAITVRRAAAITIAGAAATALSACGAGLETQTEEKASAIAGVNIDEGDLALRDLQVEYDSAEGYGVGDDAALRLWIGNEGAEEVSLESITTEAGTVTYVDPVAQAEEAAEAAREGETDETEEADDAAGDTESTEEASEPAADATEAPETDELDGEEAFAPIAIAPAEYARFDQAVSASPYFLIENLTHELVSGETVTVTFTFSDGTQFDAELPVGQALEPDDRSFFEPEEAAEGH
jgi:hypothetical protein